MSDFRHRLLDGEVLLGGFLGIGSPAVAEIMATAGLDWLVLDWEHGFGGANGDMGEIGAIRAAAIAPLVRVPTVDETSIGRALDRGATGVIVPRIRSVADAEGTAAAARYSSRRGISAMTAGLGWGLDGGRAGRDRADREVVVAVQIETREAYSVVDEIARVDGVDCLFVGPTDLGAALEIEDGPERPELLAAAERVAKAARGAGITAGVAVGSPTIARMYRDLGFTLLACTSDLGILRAGANILRSQIGDSLR